MKKDFIVRRSITMVEGKPHVETYSEQELIRCKDCRFGEPTKNMRGEHRYACINYRTGIDPDFTHKPDWFCADGVAKDINVPDKEGR